MSQPSALETWSAVWTPLVLATVVFVFAPAPSLGQTSAPPTRTTPWDAAILAGVLLGRPDAAIVPGGYDEWFDTPQVALGVSRHLTPHLRVEVDLSATGEGQQFVPQVLALPGSPYPTFAASDRFTRVTAVHGALVWQFLENQWAHPFIQIGAAASADRVRTRTWRQIVRVGPDRGPTEVVVVEDRDEGPVTRWDAGIAIGAGAKLYVTTRLFVRADARLTTLRRSTQADLRTGLGIDF